MSPEAIADMSMALPLNVLLWCWLVMAVVMWVLWGLQLRGRIATGMVDVIWSFGTGAVAVILLIWSSDGTLERRILLAMMAVAWSLRLGTHLLRRILQEGEDGRYLRMRKSLGPYAQPVLCIFFQVQAFWTLLFALPFWGAAGAASQFPVFWDIVGLLVWGVAAGGEYIADRQLRLFRSSPGNSGRVCIYGLWRYSRHPNYFFEWLHWCAYALIAMGAPSAWLSYIGVVLMYVFLVYITGIPHAERGALESRGDAYRAYQRSTSRFFPWKPLRS